MSQPPSEPSPSVDNTDAMLFELASRLDDDGRLIQKKDKPADGSLLPVAAAAAEPEAQFKRPERRARPVDRQFFDEVVIRTVPRYKTSRLSGNEWRFSAECEVKYKGRVMWEGSHSSVPGMLDEMAGVTRSDEFRELDKPDTSDLCDQEGCREPWVNTYSLKKEFCKACGHEEDPYQFDSRPLVRKFCARHSQRGDCSREDSQSNYEVVATIDNQTAGTTPVATTNAADERPAVLGGIILVDVSNV